MGEYMEFTPNWIQAGELGLAFVVTILCAWLIYYVFKQSAIREDKLMNALTQQQSLTDRQGDILQKLADHMETMNRRLEEIEKVIDDKLRSKARRTASKE